MSAEGGNDAAAVMHGRRIAALFARCGEGLTLIRAGVNRPARGVAAAMDAQTAGAYFDANEAVGLLRPALALYLEGMLPDPPLAGDVFFRDGRLWTVRKVQVFRLGDAPLLLLALCD